MSGRPRSQPQHGDPGCGEHLEDLITQDPRSIFVTLSFRTSEP